MDATTTPRFLRASTSAAALCMFVMTVTPWAVRGVSGMLGERRHDVARSTCETHEGTVVSRADQEPHCFRCASPQALPSWP